MVTPAALKREAVFGDCARVTIAPTRISLDCSITKRAPAVLRAPRGRPNLLGRSDMAKGKPRGSMAAFLEANLSDRLAARFWSKVDKHGPLPEHCPELGPCWVWTRATDPAGYGRFGIGSRGANRVFFAHRVALALTGTIPPDDLDACHRCDNPPCCNPGHLFLGTLLDNMADMVAKGRNHDDACGNGHLWTPENTRIYHWGGYDLRRCKECDRNRGYRYKKVPNPQKPGPKPKFRKCDEPGCEEPHLARGMCSSHYEKWRHREGRRKRAA
jgi:HNH endonuclease